jgi:hypothetical protein
MKLHSKIVLALAALALTAAPALAGSPHGHPSNRGATHANTHATATHTTATHAAKSGRQNQKAKAYGRFCKNEPTRRPAGVTTGKTPFAACVTAMARLAHDAKMAPKAACAAESKQHLHGHRGTPFSICVAGGKKLLKTS